MCVRDAGRAEGDGAGPLPRWRRLYAVRVVLHGDLALDAAVGGEGRVESGMVVEWVGIAKNRPSACGGMELSGGGDSER